MNELDTYRKKQHTLIRRANIHEFLARNRYLFRSIAKQPEVNTLFQDLKRIVMSQSKGEELQIYLLNLHKLVRNYEVISQLSKRVELTDSPRLRLMFGQNNQEMTNLDLLIVLLRNTQPLLNIRELTYIIRFCVAQFSRNIKQKYQAQNTKMYIQCVKKAVQNYPFEILERKDLEVVENTTIFVYDSVISCCDDGSTIYFLINKLKPGILTYFKDLLNDSLIINVSYMKHQLITTILTVIFFINRYNLVQYQAEVLDQLVFKLKDMILTEILKEESEQQFENYCQLMVILCENKQLQITKEQFQQLQNPIAKYLYQQSEEYFNVIQKVLFTHTHTLSFQKYENIVRCIFYEIANYKSYTQKDANFKIKLLNIFHLHITNCGNRFRPQDAQVFVFCWGEYSKTDLLISLIYFVQSQGHKTTKVLNNLFQVIVMVLSMQEQLQSCGIILDFSESELNVLTSFQQFNKILGIYGIELSIQ